MAERYEILDGDSSFTLRRELPADMDVTTTAKVTVTSDAGTELQAAASCTFTAATTTSAAISAGDNTTTLPGSLAWLPDDLVEVGGSGEPLERRRIRSYNSSTGATEFTKRFNHAHASGVAVKACFWTYALDASGDDYTALERGTLLWDNFSGDQIPFTDEFIIIDRHAAVAASESGFAELYPHFVALMPDDPKAWDRQEKRGMEMLRWDFGARMRDIDKVADSGSIEELLYAKIAYTVAVTNGDDWADEAARLLDYYNDRLEMFCAQPFWTDDDGDLVRDDGEDVPANAPFSFERGI